MFDGLLPGLQWTLDGGLGHREGVNTRQTRVWEWDSRRTELKGFGLRGNHFTSFRTMTKDPKRHSYLILLDTDRESSHDPYRNLGVVVLGNNKRGDLYPGWSRCPWVKFLTRTTLRRGKEGMGEESRLKKKVS